MRFVCETCKTKYTIADEKVRRKVLKIRCKNCSSIILVHEQTALPEVAGGDQDLATVADPQASERLLEGIMRGNRRSSSGLPSLSGLHRVPAPLFPVDDDDESGPESTRLSEAPDFGLTAQEHEQEDWYLAIEGQQYGPMSFSELCSRVKRGETGDEAYVWRDSFEDWVEVGEVPELKPFVPRHPPPPPRGKSGLYRMMGAPNPLVSAPPGGMAPPAPHPVPSSVYPAVSPLTSVVAPLPAQHPQLPTVSPTPAEAVPATPLFIPTATPLEAFLPGIPRQESGLLPLPVVAQPQRPTLEVPVMAPLSAGSPLQIAPAPRERTPVWLIIAGIGGGITALCGLAMVIYLFLDRGPTPSPPDPSVSESETPSVAPLASSAGVAPDAGAEIMFPPMEVEHSKRQRRGASARPSRPLKKAEAAPAPEATAEQKRLLSLYKESSTMDQLSGGREGRSASVTRRQVTFQDLQAVQRGHKAELQACYERAAKRDNALAEVKAEVRVTIGDLGTAREVKVQAGDSPELVACLERVVRRWAFPPVGSQTFVFPVLFRGQ